MVVTVSLWIDQLMNSIIGDLTSFQILYKVSSFITLAVSFNLSFSRILNSDQIILLVVVDTLVDDGEYFFLLYPKS